MGRRRKQVCLNDSNNDEEDKRPRKKKDDLEDDQQFQKEVIQARRFFAGLPLDDDCVNSEDDNQDDGDQIDILNVNQDDLEQDPRLAEFLRLDNDD